MTRRFEVGKTYAHPDDPVTITHVGDGWCVGKHLDGITTAFDAEGYGIFSSRYFLNTKIPRDGEAVASKDINHPDHLRLSNDKLGEEIQP